MLKIIEHDFIDEETIAITLKDTETGETFYGIINKEE